jgi:peptidylamidoglycolate lyase
VLQSMKQTDKIFVHPHDVCVDSDENLYVAQWASGKVYPYKLKRV